MKYLLLLSLFLCACGAENTTSTDENVSVDQTKETQSTQGTSSSSLSEQQDQAQSAEEVTLYGVLTNYDGESSDVSVYAVNSAGDVAEADISDEYVISLSVAGGETYSCYMIIDDKVSDTLSLTGVGDTEYDTLLFYNSSSSIYAYTYIESGSYTTADGHLKFDFDVPYKIISIHGADVKVLVEGYSHAITFSAEFDKDEVMDNEFSSTGSVEYNGKIYHYFSLTISGITFQQDVYFGLEADNYILLGKLRTTSSSSEISIDEAEHYMELMDHVSVIQ